MSSVHALKASSCALASTAALRGAAPCGRRVARTRPPSVCQAALRGPHAGKIGARRTQPHLVAVRALSGARAAPDVAEAGAGASAESEIASRSHGPLQRMLRGLVGYYAKGSKRIRASEVAFRACHEQASQQVMFDAIELKRDFRSEQAMLVLHVWMIHTRLKTVFKEGGRQLQEHLFERVWEAARREVRHLGVPEISVNKTVQSLQQVSFGAMISYDAGLEETDDDELALGSALWRNLFAGAQVPEDNVLRVAEYVRREVAAIHALPLDHFAAGFIPFGPAIGETGDERIARHNRLADGEWRMALTDGGAAYYHHTRTGESVWRLPEGAVLAGGLGAGPKMAERAASRQQGGSE